MEKEKFERAKMLNQRIYELAIMQKELSEKGDVYITKIKGDYSPISLSYDMKNILLDICIKEKSKYQKEFDEL